MLVLNFADNHIMLTCVLHTTIEVNCIEYHPDHPNLLFGGCLSGQIIVWDFSDETTRIITEDDASTEASEEAKDLDTSVVKAAEGGEAKEGDDGTKPVDAKPAAEEDEGHDKSTQSVIQMKMACISMIAYSHKTPVNDIKFVPRGIKVDKKRPSDGETTHFVSCAEDGYGVLIWDSRTVSKENRRQSVEEIHWKPFLNIPMFRPDGSGEQGLARILFQRNTVEQNFWVGSDEGDLIFVDWSKRPTAKEEDQTQKSDFMISRESQRNYRPILALEQSPFFEDLIMTVHDFNFCIWKVDLKDYKDPIFISSYTFGSYNT